MTEAHWLILIAALFSLALPGSIILLALKVHGLFTVTVTTPPVTVTTPPVTVNQAPITVQAPHAVLPPELMDTLQRVNEKLLPPSTPADQAQLTALVHEGVAVAEVSKLKGTDKFRIARDYVLDRARAMHLDVDPRALAMQIEACVAEGRNAKRLLAAL